MYIKFFLLSLILLFFSSSAYSQKDLSPSSLKQYNSIAINTELNWLKKGVVVAKIQLQKASTQYTPGHYPRSIWPDGEMRMANLGDWTAGFFPGSLWYAYEITQDKFFKEQAERFTSALNPLQFNKNTHDLGFLIFCSYGNGFRLTNNTKYKTVLLNASESLSSRFSETVGCIKSWDFERYSFPVIIDNMMNLELLLWASKKFDDEKYAQIAITHANTTLENHFRADNSSFHVIDYDPQTGNIMRKMTAQGYADDSAWSRGQAWGLYGFTMMYRETKNKVYLEQAKKIAAYIINSPNLPTDKIPYWDFNDPFIPHGYRDVSAATIMASALLELSTFEDSNRTYFNHAEKILKNLSDDLYLAKPYQNGFFILKHSVGNLPNYSEIDTPINYADYYYLEALIRYANITNIDLKKIASN
ncbi:glycoside hydrolase family 88 protein [Aestuariivivens insulae]|uniref:glycoside hydrolase family 88 protein n=1 Tax=Aestuariivivens insulae TaxID=1621988 RepID=UPI001F55BAD2|nr:glycoside hydrolase family 88 protein [Aestuariivivens insulae]